ncbi:hypothetical protein KPSA3_04735 [Pseudomonas syringae pv. actinidiae]|uniref:Uncharacterized protein n=1 Tax=Pseudomonas syringae pv. actinidiae TaxID=103796 RepID=A0AAN4Q733_PSESF|nr:hypothetical protein KPSA3_04735 [Pseudomonas syringae pv. actinidiae]
MIPFHGKEQQLMIGTGVGPAGGTKRYGNPTSGSPVISTILTSTSICSDSCSFTPF